MKKIFKTRDGGFIGRNFAYARRKRVKAGDWRADRKAMRRELRITSFAA